MISLLSIAHIYRRRNTHQPRRNNDTLEASHKDKEALGEHGDDSSGQSTHTPSTEDTTALPDNTTTAAAGSQTEVENTGFMPDNTTTAAAGSQTEVEDTGFIRNTPPRCSSIHLLANSMSASHAEGSASPTPSEASQGSILDASVARELASLTTTPNRIASAAMT